MGNISYARVCLTGGCLMEEHVFQDDMSYGSIYLVGDHAL